MKPLPVILDNIRHIESRGIDAIEYTRLELEEIAGLKFNSTRRLLSRQRLLLPLQVAGLSGANSNNSELCLVVHITGHGFIGGDYSKGIYLSGRGFTLQRAN